MEEMKEKKDTFEMPEIPHVAIPQLREGALTNGVTMRDHSGGSGTIKRGSETIFRPPGIIKPWAGDPLIRWPHSWLTLDLQSIERWTLSSSSLTSLAGPVWI